MTISAIVVTALLLAGGWSTKPAEPATRGASSSVEDTAAHELAIPGAKINLFHGGGIAFATQDDLFPVRLDLEVRTTHGDRHGWAIGTEGREAPWSTGAQSASWTSEINGTRVQRTLDVKDSLVIVQDAFTNTGNVEVIVWPDYSVAASAPRAHIDAGGKASSIKLGLPENPLMLLNGDVLQLAIFPVDDLMRLHLRGWWNPEGAHYGPGPVLVAPGDTRLLETWFVPLADPSADYFDALNVVRERLGSNFRIEGPADFFDVTRNWELLHDHEALSAYVARKGLRIVALNPWLDYDHFDYRDGSFMDRNSYAEAMAFARDAFHTVDPNIKVLGNVQSCLVTLPDHITEALLDIMPPEHFRQAIFYANEEEAAILDRLDEEEFGPLFRAANGTPVLEVFYPYYQDHPPMLAAGVVPLPGSAQERALHDKVTFILDEVGLDGVYIDQFNMVLSHELRYTYDRFDGHTIDANRTTGNVTARYTDAALASIPVQQGLVEAVYSRGKFLLTNTAPATSSMHGLPAPRFVEVGNGAFDPLNIPDGEEPPYLTWMNRAMLDSPLGLGYWNPSNLGSAGEENYSRVIMKSIQTYLRHGLLYHLFLTDIPTDGPGAGAYGPLPHMFPITPVSLDKGTVTGEARIVTARNGTFAWEHDLAPRVLSFDMRGEPVLADARVIGGTGKWTVELLHDDWTLLSVIEPAPGGRSA